MAIDLSALWDHSDPALSERRFRDALATAACEDDVLILQTQIARTLGLRRQFDRAREQLQEIRPRVAASSAEVRTRFELELGRTFTSATHPPELQNAGNREKARTCFAAALDLARRHRLDELAIDAVHMMAFVDTAPADQLKWAEAALAVVEASDQPPARSWEASIRNNLGYALHQLGRYEEALAQFERAVVLRERATNAEATRIAHWMIAWTLRAMGRLGDALAIQLRLERECDAAGQPDPYVFEELEALYRAQSDEARARHYAGRRRNAVG